MWDDFTLTRFVGTAIRLTLLCTPFFCLSVFFTITNGMPLSEKRHLASRTALAVFTGAMILYLFGQLIFEFLGITLDAFRIGSGLVLMLSGIAMVNSSGVPKGRETGNNDVAVVPLAIPVTLGPGTIGALLVMGANCPSAGARIVESGSIVVAASVLWAVLYFSDFLARLLKEKGIVIVTKLTGMYLVALAAEIMFTGIAAFLNFKN